VGINTAIFSRTGSSMGIGFAIPANLAQSVMQSLISTGRVVRGQIGVRIQDLTEGLAESFGYRGTDGALVGEVTAGSPAARAGIREGDILTRFDGQPVTGVASLRGLVAATRPGQRVPVEIFRDGRRQTLTIQVAEQETPRASRSKEPTGSHPMGVVVRDLDAAIAQQIGLSASTRGALVVEVEPLSAAENAGVQPNEVIVSVQGEPVRSAGELRQALARHDLKRGVRLGLLSANGRRYAFVRADGAS
jgi:serine protease Do